MAPAFEKGKSFIAKSIGEETGGKTQICVSDQGFGATFKGLGGTGWCSEALAGQVSIGGVIAFDHL